MAKDIIEEKVTAAVREYLLDDDVITWIANGYQKFLDAHRRDSALISMQEELTAVEKGIKNIVAAIEQGIFTPSTKERLIELESEKQSLQASIAVTEATLENVPRERIEYWLRSFRGGDTKSKAYQAKLIDSFVQAVYLYDDSIRIVCNYTGKSNEITVSLSATDSAISGDADLCSLKLSSGVPLKKPRIVKILGFFCTFAAILKSGCSGFWANFGLNSPQIILPILKSSKSQLPFTANVTKIRDHAGSGIGG